MNVFKHMFAGILFAIAIAQPAVAGALNQADIDFVFDPAAGYTVDGLIPLSPEEMDQIEGQYWVRQWQQIARAVQGFYNGIQRGVTFSIGRFTYYIRHDPKSHMFGREWGRSRGTGPIGKSIVGCRGSKNLLAAFASRGGQSNRRAVTRRVTGAGGKRVNRGKRANRLLCML